MVATSTLQLVMTAFLAILYSIFGYEYRFPLWLNVVLVPLIVGLGYLFAPGLHFGDGLEMTIAMSVEFVLLLGSIMSFEILTS